MTCSQEDSVNNEDEYRTSTDTLVNNNTNRISYSVPVHTWSLITKLELDT